MTDSWELIRLRHAQSKHDAEVKELREVNATLEQVVVRQQRELNRIRFQLAQYRGKEALEGGREQFDISNRPRK